jgi:hypothetical protein
VAVAVDAPGAGHRLADLAHQSDRHADLGISNADADCVGHALDEDRLVCHAFDGTRTRVVEVDPATGRINPLATLHGRFISHGRAGGGWLTGW